MEGDVPCDGGVVIWRQMCHVMEGWSEADVSCDGGVVRGRCVM